VAGGTKLKNGRDTVSMALEVVCGNAHAARDSTYHRAESMTRRQKVGDEALVEEIKERDSHQKATPKAVSFQRDISVV